MTYTLVEPCSGSAALTFHLLGARKSILPYQGSKWRFRRGLQEKAEALGFIGRPEKVVLTDPGPWGTALKAVLDPTCRKGVIQRLRFFAVQDPRAVFDQLHRAPAHSDLVDFTAEILFLQRLAFSGKAVGTKRGRWFSPGFNAVSAYGVEATEHFGKVNPMVPSLIRALVSYDRDLALVEADVRRERASAPTAVDGRVLVYLDPPYSGSTPYPDGNMSREEVVTLASAWAEAGAAVMVSEQTALPSLAWRREQLSRGRRDTSPFRGKQQEWVTFTGSDHVLR